MSTRFLPEQLMLEKAGLSRSEMRRRMAAGTFPMPIKLSPDVVGPDGTTKKFGIVRWIESEIDHWIEARIREGRLAPVTKPKTRLTRRKRTTTSATA